MKKIKKILVIIIVITITSTITFFVGRQIGLNTDISSTSTTIEEKTVSKRNIIKTLTATGEIETATSENLSIETTKYFETMCVEEDDTVKAGENILKYTNGTYLTAPYDLVVSGYSIPNTGEKATSSNYVEVKCLSDLKTTITINENEISNINVGQEVEITLTADTSKTYKGTIIKIDSIGSYSTSGTTFSATVTFSNDGNAKLGMSVSCTINISELSNVLVVPINAVQTTNNKKYVIVIENGETREVEIETGLSDDEYVEVISGLTEGEVVQVTTTTKKNTIRNNSTNAEGENIKQDFAGGDKQGFDKSQMPTDMKGGGDAPSMKGN